MMNLSVRDFAKLTTVDAKVVVDVICKFEFVMSTTPPPQ